MPCASPDLNRLAPVSRRPGRFVALDLGLWILTKNASKKIAKVSWEKDIYIYIHIYIYIYHIFILYIRYGWFAITINIQEFRNYVIYVANGPKVLHCPGAWGLCQVRCEIIIYAIWDGFVQQYVLLEKLACDVSPEIGPQFPEHGAGNWAPVSGKIPPPEIGAQFGPRVGGIEPATFRLQACAPPTRPNSGGQHGHTSSFATWPSPPVPAWPNPKSKLQTGRLDFGFWSLEFGFWSLEFGVWILDFGSWILDLGFWILDLGFWILDFGFWISLVFVLFAAAPNGPVWILELGFWILDFGFWILGLD